MKNSPIIRIVRLFSDRQKTAYFLVALVTLASAFDIAVPFISQKLIDALIVFFKDGTLADWASSPLQVLAWSSSGILIATVINRIMRSIYDYRLFLLVTSTEDVLRAKAFEKYLRLHALYHHGSSSGQVMSRIERGCTAVYAIMHDIIGQTLLPPLLIFTGVFLSLLFKNGWIALATILPFPIYLLAIRNLSRRIYEEDKSANEKYEVVSKESYDIASNVLTVKKFSQEKAETENQVALLKSFRAVQYGSQRLWAVLENVQTVVATLGRIAVIMLAGFFVLQGKSTVGEFVLYVTLQNMAYAPLWQLSNVLPRMRRNMSRVEKLFEILDEDVRVKDAPHAAELPLLKEKIEFKDAYFRYGPNRGWALENINLSIPAKTTVALVGRSGSGKTTFINLLLRSYDVSAGAILFDGTDIREVTQESLRRQIAVVPQEVDLFSRSIGENIAYGISNATSADIKEAAKTALAHDFIMATDQGYDTLVGERGVRLSGGERQRIGIARAVLRDPKILILDEATSHLDTESERLIQKATDALTKDRTTFIIAHRLSTVLTADMILVFDKGSIEAVGTHKELLEKSPTYKRLHEMQFAD